MNESLLKLVNVNVAYNNLNSQTIALRDMCMTIKKGERIGLIGESGSGKTTTILSIMGLLDKLASVSGEIFYGEDDLEKLRESQRNKYRWKHISLVFQNNLGALNPLLTVRQQISEAISRHLKLSAAEMDKRILALLNEVGLDPKWADSYPNQLSGGMLQRVFIAMALSCEPEVLLVDEPTTALDAVAKNDIIDLLDKLQKEKNFAILVSSHEISTIQRLTDRIIVLYQGCILESGYTKDVVYDPLHPYTRGLINSSTQINEYRDLWGIPQEDSGAISGGCPFHLRCSQSTDECRVTCPRLESAGNGREISCLRGGIVKILEGRGITKRYKTKSITVEACKGISISISAGEVVALIGESGSGKSTLANIICGMLSKDGGEVLYEGTPLEGFEATRKLDGIQITFQDAFSSLNDSFSIYRAIEEPLRLLKIGAGEERRGMITQALRDVQLPADEAFTSKKCFMLSGGQRQRVALARSLVMKPRLLVADEISSMLDPSTQANILRLLKGIQNSKGFSMLYITHDLSLARKIADKVCIMRKGEIIERGSALEVFRNPQSKYAKRLISSANV